MKATLTQIIHRRMTDHYPEKLLEMQLSGEYTSYLQRMSEMIWGNWYLATEGQDISVGLELVRETLLHLFGASAFDYVETLLCTHFSVWHKALVDGGIARYEIMNILHLSVPLWSQFPIDADSEPHPELTNQLLELIRSYRIPSYQLTI
ncbi:hypothetical protein ACQKLP_10950 [Chitinophaga sp. NPDC101104]|uniref:hypothetical protein n=1 Tax=Chitinophaga sp. NPDC101104 TaxID=3390561 RepID=UPI003D060536